MAVAEVAGGLENSRRLREQLKDVVVNTWDSLAKLSQKVHIGKRVLAVILLGATDITVSAAVYHFDSKAIPTLPEALGVGTVFTSLFPLGYVGRRWIRPT